MVECKLEGLISAKVACWSVFDDGCDRGNLYLVQINFWSRLCCIGVPARFVFEMCHCRNGCRSYLVKLEFYSFSPGEREMGTISMHLHWAILEDLSEELKIHIYSTQIYYKRSS